MYLMMYLGYLLKYYRYTEAEPGEAAGLAFWMLAMHVLAGAARRPGRSCSMCA